ncbi:hypothetical protein CVIRNUC_000440 [Coccomyxa viridis]|uniref:Pyridoxamine 5'-phosphate oxidase Alr4036 family FMN-binding domain-containing protein n=1 Tax=Coccomyxa viridis TaxID=1274662 RepID=A0AAV1HRE2_9CHLO|nr:hypothetical protein CVIRNUC_000440 [Coccomyxa viridis]
MAVAWKSTLNKALEANKHLKYSTFFQLATVRPDGKPSVRTVVFRGFLDESTKITFTTDTRTFKVEHVKQSPWAEACWYFPDSREQFRLGGDLVIVGPDHPDAHLREARQDAWNSMSTGGRSWFGWPASGRPREPNKEEFEKPIPDKGEEALPSFALVYMDVDTVDYVLLPDVRVGYGSTADKGGTRQWHEQELNP